MRKVICVIKIHTTTTSVSTTLVHLHEQLQLYAAEHLYLYELSYRVHKSCKVHVTVALDIGPPQAAALIQKR